MVRFLCIHCGKEILEHFGSIIICEPCGLAMVVNAEDLKVKVSRGIWQVTGSWVIPAEQVR